MNIKVGAERNKVLLLAGLSVVGGWLFYNNVIAGPDAAPVSTAPKAAAPKPVAARPAAPGIETAKAAPGSRRSGRASSAEFRPSLKKRPEDAQDPATIDPTLRLDLIDRLQKVSLEGGQRNLFQFTTAAPPPEALPKTPEPKIVTRRVYGPQPPPPPAPPVQAMAPPPAPPPPPLTVKYYGFLNPKGDTRRRAFFLDGEEILVVSEGDVLKKRYRVVRVGLTSVVVEDTETKAQQTLPIQQEAAG